MFASAAPIVVVLRRGPTDWVEVVQWDTSNDTFADGQWFHGRIFGERCGLSPNGKLFVYFAAKHGRVDKAKGYEDTFTAVSKPPYLTALALWPEGSTWGGGGRFIDNKTLRLAYGRNGTRAPDGKTELYMAPLPPHHPSHPPLGLTVETDLDHYDTDGGFRVVDVSREADWIGRDHKGRTIFIRAGALYYVNKNRREALLRDFNTDVRREVVAPRWAKRW